MSHSSPRPHAKPSQSTGIDNTTPTDARQGELASPRAAFVTKAEFIARQMRIGTTPTVGMATAYFNAGLRKGTINKVGRDLYVEGPVPELEEGELWEGDPMDCD